MRRKPGAARELPGPVIVWHSDPVAPGETVLIQGGEFSDGATLEFSRIPDDPDAGPCANAGGPEHWETVLPLQRSPQNIKAVVPSGTEAGIFFCRARQEGEVSNTVMVNAPDPWWMQGEAGEAQAHPGGWLRIFGKCLFLARSCRVILRSGEGEISLPVSGATSYGLTVSVPSGTPSGSYEAWVHNGCGGIRGWKPAGMLSVREPGAPPSAVLNAVELGADPTGRRDSTVMVVQALERLAGLGGGVVYFPRGHYRIDSNLRSGMHISHPLKLPAGTSLRGESADRVTLWWPERDEPLPTLIEGSADCAVEDVTILTHGRHRNIISGESGSRIRRVRIRANCDHPGSRYHRQGAPENPVLMGAALELTGEGIQVTDCDIYHSAVAFSFRHVRGGYMARNTARAANFVSINGGRAIIFEDNVFFGNQLSSGGNNISLHFGATSCRHVYYARNEVSHIYGGDHEALTLDGHGTAYLGLAETVEGAVLTLAEPPRLGVNVSRDSLSSLHDTTAYILSGRGAGQYRPVVAWEGRRLTLESPWMIEPDAGSVVSVGVFNGRHLIIGNTARDAGALVQLYPPNCECIVAENKGIHCGGINGTGRLGVDRRNGFPRAEPSWFNQFFDNHVVWGNGWGGGESDIDRWLGGEGSLCLWGSYLLFSYDDGKPVLRLPGPDELDFLPSSGPPPFLPISRCQVIRRHRVDNNHSIRIRGAVEDALVESCVIRDSARGIRVDQEPDTAMPGDLDMLRFEPAAGRPDPGRPHLSPRGILVRNNQMENVRVPYAGTALASAKILPTPTLSS